MAEAEKQAQGAAVADADQFAELLQKQFKPKTDRARAEVERAVQTLAEQALRDTMVVSDDVVGTIKAIIAELDKKLTDQVNDSMPMAPSSRSVAEPVKLMRSPAR